MSQTKKNRGGTDTLDRRGLVLLNLRLTKPQRDLLHSAARRTGASSTGDWILALALERAREVCSRPVLE